MSRLKRAELKFGLQERAVELSKWFKKAGKVIVTTNGIFDILHAGHVRYLAEAKALGDFLIVLVNSDNSTKKIKGNHKPYIPCNQRMEVVSALQSVDFVTWFCEDTPETILGMIKPNVHVKGKDCEGKDVPEAEVVKKHGGEMKFVDVHSKEYLSTSTIAQRIVQISFLQTAVRKALESAEKIPPNYYKDSVIVRLSEALEKSSKLD